jgi:hypothetical protein
VLVQLIHDALTEHSGSGNKCFQKASEEGTLVASSRAAYGKLGRIPTKLSVDLFATMTDRLLDLFPQPIENRLPKCFAQMRVLTVDGKTIKRIAKRLKPLRKVRCGLVGGKALVATDHLSGTAVGLMVDPDGDANDVRLLPGLLANVRDRLDESLLWLADRQFCDLVQLGRFCEQGDSYVVRYNAKAHFFRDGNEPVREGTDASGRAYTDECGWLGADSNRNQRYVRRITLQINDRDHVAIVTELFGTRKFPATDLLDLYADRWEIERVFQKVTEVFSLKNLIGGTPQANLFQFSLCLLLYNQLQLVRSYVAIHQEMDVQAISIENLFTDVQRELIAWTVVIPALQTEALVPVRSIKQTRAKLVRLLRTPWSDRWIKATNPPGRTTRKTATQKKHSSVFKLLNPHPD